MRASTFSLSEYDLAYPPGVENNYWTQARVSILLRVLHSNNLVGKKILEIGCGKGIVVNALRKESINCLGAELADIDPVAEVHGFVFPNQDATQLDESLRHSIEVILLLDVIEHIQDDAAFLTSIKKAFPKASHMLVMVPARKEIWSNYDEFYGHFRRYDRPMMRGIARTTGQTLQFCSYFFHSLFLIAFVTLSFTKGKRTVKVTPPRGIMILFHKLIALFFSTEYILCPRSFYGSSIVALYKTE